MVCKKNVLYLDCKIDCLNSLLFVSIVNIVSLFLIIIVLMILDGFLFCLGFSIKAAFRFFVIFFRVWLRSQFISFLFFYNFKVI